MCVWFTHNKFRSFIDHTWFKVLFITKPRKMYVWRVKVKVKVCIESIKVKNSLLLHCLFSISSRFRFFFVFGFFAILIHAFPINAYHNQCVIYFFPFNIHSKAFGVLFCRWKKTNRKNGVVFLSDLNTRHSTKYPILNKVSFVRCLYKPIARMQCKMLLFYCSWHISAHTLRAFDEHSPFPHIKW